MLQVYSYSNYHANKVIWLVTRAGPLQLTLSLSRGEQCEEDVWWTWCYSHCILSASPRYDPLGLRMGYLLPLSLVKDLKPSRMSEAMSGCEQCQTCAMFGCDLFNVWRVMRRYSTRVEIFPSGRVVENIAKATILDNTDTKHYIAESSSYIFWVSFMFLYLAHVGVLTGKYSASNPPPGGRGRTYNADFLTQVCVWLSLCTQPDFWNNIMYLESKTELSGGPCNLLNFSSSCRTIRISSYIFQKHSEVCPFTTLAV